MPKAAAKKPKTTNHNVIVVMQYIKSTKGTHVYAADESLTEDETPVCTQVYLKKEALPEDPPATIQLTVSYEA
jgi:hypothetical protein